VARENRAAELIDSAVVNWSLPTDTQFSIVNATRRTTLQPEMPLSERVVSDRDELEIQPVLVAGACRASSR
jgi:hypothetical protein